MALTTVSALLAAAAEGGGGGLTDVNLGLTIWTVVLFALFAFVLGKLGWKPLLDFVEQREQSIRLAVEGAQRANADAQALLIEQKQILQEAGRQREDIVKRAVQDAEELRAQLVAEARAESEKLVQRAREQIEREKKLALEEIRAQVAELAIGAAAKIVASSLTPEVQRKLVDEFLDQVPPRASS
jgi:F-type H+-transporting ATPase subunit b